MARICMMSCSFYPDDPRPRREAEALAEAGHDVEIVCLAQAGQAPRETIRGVTAHRVGAERRRGGMARYLYDYGRFFVLFAAKLTRLHARRPYDLIHVHNMPEALIFAALGPRLGGARLLLDLHDPTPEVFQTKFALAPGSWPMRLLTAIERWSIRAADQVITTNQAFLDVFVARGCPAQKIEIIMNSPQESIFAPALAASADLAAGPLGAPDPSRYRIMLHGGLYERHGIGTALAAVSALRDQLPLELHVFGDGDYRPAFEQQVRALALAPLVKDHGPVPLETIARAIAQADIGLVPNLRTPFTEINLPTRIFEFLCLGRPVIAPRTRGIRDYFAEDALCYFEPGDSADLARVLARTYHEPAWRQAALERGRQVYQQHVWAQESRRLVALVEGLLAHGAPGHVAALRPSPPRAVPLDRAKP